MDLIETCYPCDYLKSTEIIFIDVETGEKFVFPIKETKESKTIIDGKEFYLKYDFGRLSSRYPQFTLTWGKGSSPGNVGIHTDNLNPKDCKVEK